MGKMKGVTGVENEVLFDEVRKATEERYPISDGRNYILVVNVYDHIRENKDKYPNLNKAPEQHLKRMITQTYLKEFKWQRYGNTKTTRIRSAVFNRSIVVEVPEKWK